MKHVCFILSFYANVLQTFFPSLGRSYSLLRLRRSCPFPLTTIRGWVCTDKGTFTHKRQIYNSDQEKLQVQYIRIRMRLESKPKTELNVEFKLPVLPMPCGYLRGASIRIPAVARTCREPMPCPKFESEPSPPPGRLFAKEVQSSLWVLTFAKGLADCRFVMVPSDISQYNLWPPNLLRN